MTQTPQHSKPVEPRCRCAVRVARPVIHESSIVTWTTAPECWFHGGTPSRVKIGYDPTIPDTTRPKTT